MVAVAPIFGSMIRMSTTEDGPTLTSISSATMLRRSEWLQLFEKRQGYLQAKPRRKGQREWCQTSKAE